MALNEDPIFTLEIVKESDKKIDQKVKNLRRIPKPKNDTDTTAGAGLDDFNIDDLKNFDPTKFDPS